MSPVNQAPKNLESITAIIEKVRCGTLGADEIIHATRSRIAKCDGDIKAWKALDWDQVEEQYQELMSRPNWRTLPLAAVPIAIKDVYDTANFVTTYGSVIYQHHRPDSDAKLVAILRSLGAIVIGKTVTTEFAYWQAGPTVNPYDHGRTPGGSSSGSAAAVATGMVPFALGSQTAASTIRPASYCGIIGFKPSFGLLPVDGVKNLAPSLDTIGLFTRSIDDLIVVMNALLTETGIKQVSFKSKIKLLPELVLSTITGSWEPQVADACMAAVAECYSLANANGCKSGEVIEFVDFDKLTSDQVFLMAAEAAHSFSDEWQLARDKLSDHIKALITEGQELNVETKARFEETQQQIDDYENKLFGASDILISPSTIDTAPALADGTGSPLMSRAFTLLGLPSLSLPFGLDAGGMPVGVQVLARRGADMSLLLFAERYLIKGC
ncbi:amidase [Alphaproteobacteria bacterium]|nr:amidase [Alphaproteobacteria bacterium]